MSSLRSIASARLSAAGSVPAAKATPVGTTRCETTSSSSISTSAVRIACASVGFGAGGAAVWGASARPAPGRQGARGGLHGRARGRARRDDGRPNGERIGAVVRVEHGASRCDLRAGDFADERADLIGARDVRGGDAANLLHECRRRRRSVCRSARRPWRAGRRRRAERPRRVVRHARAMHVARADVREDRLGRLVLEETGAAERLPQQRAEAVDVRPCIGRRPGQNLRRDRSEPGRNRRAPRLTNARRADHARDAVEADRDGARAELSVKELQRLLRGRVDRAVERREPGGGVE